MSDIQTTVHLHGDEGMAIHRVQQVGDAIDVIKAMSNEGLHGSKDTRYAGWIPNVVIEDYLNKNGLTLRRFMQERKEHIPRILNDPAYADLRVWRGRI